MIDLSSLLMSVRKLNSFGLPDCESFAYTARQITLVGESRCIMGSLFSRIHSLHIIHEDVMIVPIDFVALFRHAIHNNKCNGENSLIYNDEQLTIIKQSCILSYSHIDRFE